MRTIVLNTLALVDDMKKNGKKQQDYFELLPGAGIQAVEVRREFFDNPLLEAPIILDYAANCQLDVFYSVPAPLYQNQHLDQENLKQFQQEAKAMKIKRIKLVIGDYQAVTTHDLKWLDEHFTQEGIQLSVENDQTRENGRVEKFKDFLTHCYQQSPNTIDMTFDVGNWIYTGENPNHAAESLSPYVGFIHLKDVFGQPPETCLLGQGNISLGSLVSQMSADIPVAIEYPCGTDVMATIREEVLKIKTLLQAY